MIYILYIYHISLRISLFESYWLRRGNATLKICTPIASFPGPSLSHPSACISRRTRLKAARTVGKLEIL